MVSQLMADPDCFGGRTTLITFDDGYIDNVEAASALHRRGMQATWYVVSGSVGHEPSWPFDCRPACSLMAVAELRQLQTVGMEIRSHSLPQRRMIEIDPEAQRLTRAKSGLLNLLGTEVRAFAYPYGDFDDACTAAVREAGYHSACTTSPGWTLRDGDPFRVRRLTNFNVDTLGTFARELVFAAHDVERADMERYWAQRAMQRIARQG